MKRLRAGRGASADTLANDHVRNVVLQAASLLLDYPGAEAEKDARLIAMALDELPAGPGFAQLDQFLGWWLELSPVERQTHYVEIFDLREDVSLYLTDARPGDSRHRGPALLALRQAYRQRGADVTASELPDYLPLMLEVAANVSGTFVLLAAERRSLERLKQSLEEAGSPFHLVLAAVLAAVPPTPRGSDTVETDQQDRPLRPPCAGLPCDGSAP